MSSVTRDMDIRLRGRAEAIAAGKVWANRENRSQISSDGTPRGSLKNLQKLQRNPRVLLLDLIRFDWKH